MVTPLLRTYPLDLDTYNESNNTSSTNKEGTYGIHAYKTYDTYGTFFRAYRVNQDFTLTFGTPILFPGTDDGMYLPGFPEWVYPTVVLYQIFNNITPYGTNLHAVRINTADLSLTINQIVTTTFGAISAGYGTGHVLISHTDFTNEGTVLYVDVAGNGSVTTPRQSGLPTVQNNDYTGRLSNTQYIVQRASGGMDVITVDAVPSVVSVTSPPTRLYMGAANTTHYFPMWPVVDQRFFAMFDTGSYLPAAYDFRVAIFQHASGAVAQFGTSRNMPTNNFLFYESLGNGTICKITAIFPLSDSGYSLPPQPVQVEYDMFGTVDPLTIPAMPASGDPSGYYDMGYDGTARARSNGVLLFTTTYDDWHARAYINVIYTPEASITGTVRQSSAKFLRKMP